MGRHWERRKGEGAKGGKGRPRGAKTWVDTALFLEVENFAGLTH